MNYYFLPYIQLQAGIDQLQQLGYECIGPQVRDDVIVYDQLNTVEQLPWGIIEHQDPGRYRLEKTDQRQAFMWINALQAIKPLLFKPQELLWKVKRDSQGKLSFQPAKPKPRQLALLGMRACDIAGMLVQDKVFIEGVHPDPYYQQQRQQLFIIAMNCGRSGTNCFCLSTGDGPAAQLGYDVAMTEINDGFVIYSDSHKGRDYITALQLELASESQLAAHQQAIANAMGMQKKKMPVPDKLPKILLDNLEHPRWDEVAERCLSCGNCTSVCPTCFCFDETEQASIKGDSSEHHRQWDSCFTADHSYVGGTTIRDTTKKRYRQWLTHKLGSWWQQFGCSGCVGCGRCVTWCPVGIDITEEVAAISGESNQVEFSSEQGSP